MSIPLSGNLQGTSLPDLLETLGMKKVTGTLVLRRGDVIKSIHVKDGQIVFATSTDVNDRLGESLVRAGRISRKDLDNALQQHWKQAGLKKLGAILVEQGLITPKDLFNGLKAQVRNIIVSLFLWREGGYRFEERLPADVIPLQIDMQEIITEVISRMRQGS